MIDVHTHKRAARTRLQTTSQPDFATRAWIALGGIVVGLVLTIGRLFYWQIIQGPVLAIAAQEQYQRTITTTGNRGSIYTADDHLLVTNQVVYRLFLEPQLFTDNPQTVAHALYSALPDVFVSSDEEQDAKALQQQNTEYLSTKLATTDQKWVSVLPQLTEEQKQKVQELDIAGLGFEPYQKRYYPEASMAAHLTGFVGKTDAGEDVGYFGVEGGLDSELKARNNTKRIEADALGREFLEHFDPDLTPQDGRDVVLTIRRDVQQILETELQAGVERFGGKAGEILVMEPDTGKILGYAATPSYGQERFIEYEPELYKNPGLTSAYEPGSTFKILTVAAGIDAGLINPDTPCTSCGAPRVFGKYTIKTWNEQYVPNISMKDALKNSDNTAMIFVAELLGAERMQEYLHKFGISEETGIELQEDTSTPFPSKWGPVEMATISFGQGITTNSFQLVRAVAAIANGGTLMKPYIVDHVVDPYSKQQYFTQPTEVRQAVSPATARTVTEMMVYAAQTRRQDWGAFEDVLVAGKTGSSQIADAGSYADDRTIVSYVGFAPADDPQFVMLVKVVEPTSSRLSSLTTAPLWYTVAEKLLLIL